MFYYYKCLPIVCIISYSTFETFPLIIQWVVEQTSQNAYLLHYMDDFLCGGVNEAEWAKTMDTFMQVYTQLIWLLLLKRKLVFRYT